MVLGHRNKSTARRNICIAWHMWKESQFSRTFAPVVLQMSNQSAAGYHEETIISPTLINQNNFKKKTHTFYNCVKLCQDFNDQSLKDIKMCTANSVSSKSHNGVCHPRGNPFVYHYALCPLKYKGFFCMSLLLFGMIETLWLLQRLGNHQLCTIAVMDGGACVCAGERIKTIKQRRMEGRLGSCAKALITLLGILVIFWMKSII